MNNLWWMFSLCASFSSAIYTYTNQVFKMNGRLVMIYRGLLVALIMTPFLFSYLPIKNPYFYLICVVQGIVVGFNNNRLFRAAKAFGAEMTATIQPIAISIMFVMWLLITPSEFFVLWGRPFHFTGIILCLFGVTFAVMQMKKAKTNKVAFIYMLPVLFTTPIIDIMNKKAMQAGAENLDSAVVYYVCLTALVCGLSNLFVYVEKKQKLSLIVKKSNLKKGFFVALSAIAITSFKNLSMYYTENPAYVSAIILLAPVWIISADGLYIFLTHKKTGYKHVSIPLVILLIGSIIGLILLNQKK